MWESSSGLNTFASHCKCDHHTVKRSVTESQHKPVCAVNHSTHGFDKGTMRKLSARQIHQIKTAAAKRPLQSSKQIFAAGASGVPGVGSSTDLNSFDLSKYDLMLQFNKFPFSVLYNL